jgi:hypothetical protein
MGELRSEIGNLKAELKSEIGKLERKLESCMDRITERFDSFKNNDKSWLLYIFSAF